MLKYDLMHNERFLNLYWCEAFWFYKLGTLPPNGLNEELEVHTVIQDWYPLLSLTMKIITVMKTIKLFFYDVMLLGHSVWDKKHVSD